MDRPTMTIEEGLALLEQAADEMGLDGEESIGSWLIRTTGLPTEVLVTLINAATDTGTAADALIHAFAYGVVVGRETA